MESPFINKLQKIMEDPQNAQVICWSLDQTRIEILNQKIFEEKILAKNFRHNRIASFIRQLNLYGFKKIRCAQHRIFTHSLLQKGLGLEVITSRRRVCDKKNEENGDLLSNPNMNELHFQKITLSKKETQSERSPDCFIIPQQSKTNEKQQGSIPSTPSVMSPIFIMPIQQNMWQMPYISSSEGIVFNFNSFTNW